MHHIVRFLFMVSLGLEVIILLVSCGGSNQQTTTSIEPSNTHLASDPTYQRQSAIVLDFYNVKGNPEYTYLSEQIAEKIYQKINRVFRVTDIYYVHQYCQRENIQGKSLTDLQAITSLGKYFDADVVIYGSFVVDYSKVQIIGKMTNLDGTKYNDFSITSDIKEVLPALDQIAEVTYSKSLTTFPPIPKTMNTLVEKSTDISSLMDVVDHYLDGLEVSEKHTPKPDQESINEFPSPRPEWTHTIPHETGYYYYIGQSMGKKDYGEGLNEAIQDAFWAMSYSVGTNVETTYQESHFEGTHADYKEVTSSIIVETLNFVRGDEMLSKYYRQLNDQTFEVCVLFRVPLDQLKANMAESIAAETSRLQTSYHIALAEKEKQESERVKSETAKLEAQIKLLETLQKQNELKDPIASSAPKYTYITPDPSIRVTSLPPEQLVGKKNEQEAPPAQTASSKDAGTQKSSFRAPGWIFTTLGLISIGIGSSSLIRARALNNDADDLYAEYQTALKDTNTLKALLESMYKATTDKRYDADRARNVGLIFAGTGVASVTFGMLFLFKKKPAPNNKVSWQVFPFESGIGSNITIRF